MAKRGSSYFIISTVWSKDELNKQFAAKNTTK